MGTRIALVIIAIALLALCTTFYVTNSGTRAAHETARPALTPAPANHSATTIAADVSAVAPEIEERSPTTSVSATTPTAPTSNATTVADSIGDEAAWRVEYANKPLDVLVADEARLLAEHKQDLDAEVEKRFQDGRYQSYAQGTQPTSGVTVGIRVGRGDAQTIKYVDIDPRIEPEFFRKQRKALWLAGEIKRRG